MREVGIKKGIVLLFLLIFIGSIISNSAVGFKLEKTYLINSKYNENFESNSYIFVDDDNKDGPWEGSYTYPYQFIQEGVNACKEGWTLFVFNGYYNEQIVIDKSVRLISENKDFTIIDGNQANKEYEGIVTLNSDFIQFSGFTVINGSNAKRSSGICLKQYSKNNNICDNIVFDCLIGIRLIQFNDDNTISNNIITNFTSYGILLEKSDFNHVYDNIITKNGVGSGIQLENSRGNYIVGNSVSYMEKGIVIAYGDSNINTISGNVITDCSMYGVYLYKTGIFNIISLNDFLMFTGTNNPGMSPTPATFMDCLEPRFNIWIHNSWPDSKSGIYVIIGTHGIHNTPRFNFDIIPIKAT